MKHPLTGWRGRSRYPHEGIPTLLGNGAVKMQYSDATVWYLNALPHRTDGPAIIRRVGVRRVSLQYWVRGLQINPAEAEALLEGRGGAGEPLLWAGWEPALVEELVAAGVGAPAAVAAKGAGVMTKEGLRKCLLEGVPVEWVLTWERAANG